MPKPKMQFRLDETLLKKLDRLAMLEHRSKSNVVENIVREYFVQREAEGKKQNRAGGDQ